MNYNEFNCILFESKLGRNEIKKAANIYWKKMGTRLIPNMIRLE